MYILEQKIYFYLLLFIPILVLLFITFNIWKKKTQQTFADRNMLNRLSPSLSKSKPTIKFIILSISLMLLTIALVNPQMGAKIETVKREGIDIVFAFDVSKSMLAEDIAPNRLEKSKRIVSEIINNLVGDRIGIIAYAASAVPLLPITKDLSAGKLFLNNLNTDLISSQGTAVKQAINLSIDSFNDTEQKNRVVIILSDGEDHEIDESTLSEVQKGIDKGITFYTIGIGTTKGGPIPLKKRGIIDSYKKDKEGNVVISRMNETILSQIATKGNGKYINGSSTDSSVAFFIDAFKEMDKTEFETTQFSEYKDQFSWFLIFALILLVIEIFTFEKKTLWIEKIHILNSKESKQ